MVGDSMSRASEAQERTAAPLAPSYEYADDPRAYRTERAAYLAQRAVASAVVELLLRATGAYGEWPVFEPTRETYEAHRAAVAHFAGFLRRGGPAWRPSPLLARAMAARGVTFADLQEAV